MSFIDNTFKSLPEQLLGTFGIDVTYIKAATSQTYNTSTGKARETKSDSTIKGVFENVTQREVSDLIQADDRKCMISAASVSNVPTTKDKIIYNSVTYQIISVKTVSQAGIDLSYELVLRA